MFYDLLFRVVLWLLGLRLRWLGRHNAAFRAELAAHDFVMQLRTFDGRAARAFHFLRGQVLPLPGLVAAPSVTLSFLGSHYALQVLLAVRNDVTAMMRGLQEQKVTVEGDMAKMVVFMQVAGHLRLGGPGPA
jgi:hypothetical protein